MSPLPQKAIANTQTAPGINAEEINVPLDLLAGSMVGIFVLFFSVVWWVRGLSSKVDSNTKLLQELESQLEKEHAEDQRHRKEMKEEIRIAFKTEIAQSASDICHGFELFAMEMRTEIRKLSDGLECRGVEIEKITKRVDRLAWDVGKPQNPCSNRKLPRDDDDIGHLVE